jgi:hypothetical protein
MGRYAFFNTDYEYKFWFAIQPSEDIWEFGGEDISEEDEPEHRWVAAKDLEYIRAKLLVCAKDNGVVLPDFEKFEKSVDGTYEMAKSIENQKFVDEKKAAWFYLGCIIYHQLLWNSELTARYEL